MKKRYEYNNDFLKNTIRETINNGKRLLFYPVLCTDSPIELQLEIVDLEDIQTYFIQDDLYVSKTTRIFHGTDSNEVYSKYLESLDHANVASLVFSKPVSNQAIQIDEIEFKCEEPVDSLRRFSSRALMLSKKRFITLELQYQKIKKLLNVSPKIDLYEPLLWIIYSKLNKDGFFLNQLLKAGTVNYPSCWGYRGNVDRGNTVVATNVKVYFSSYALGKQVSEHGAVSSNELKLAFDQTQLSQRTLFDYLPVVNSKKIVGLTNKSLFFDWISKNEAVLNDTCLSISNIPNQVALYCFHYFANLGCYLPLAVCPEDNPLFSFGELVKHLQFKKVN